MNGQNNWNVSYSSISFMESVLANHKSVESFARDYDILFDIVRKNGLSSIRAILIDEYDLGEAAAYRVLSEFESVGLIVNNGGWNRIILDRRDFAYRTGVVVLEFSDFLGALNIENLEKYVPKSER